jgi:3-hydroxyisobutyrate dehydrogenase-like beta-hydroxyacid dehydrogenase
MRTIETLGFIGLGVMGEPMCANLIRKSGRQVYGHDTRREPLARLAAIGLNACGSIAEVAAAADAIFLSLPSVVEVEAVCFGPGGIASAARRTHTIVDMSTSSVALTRALAGRLAQNDLTFLDAPVARTRQAARDGSLSIMVGGPAETFEAIRPLLAHMGNEINHCGDVGAGQVVKILNNMVLMVTGHALAEALATARKAGVDGGVLFEVMSKGSADSFVLRNHGLKAMLPDVFPLDAFPTEYALKDMRLALELARDGGINARAAALTASLFEDTIRAGYGREYWPVMKKLIG